MNEVELIQKRVVGVDFPDNQYSRALERLCLDLLDVHHKTLCQSLFKSINNVNHRLHCLLAPFYDSQYKLRQIRKFLVPNFKTNRCKKSLYIFPVMIQNVILKVININC